MNPTRRLAPLVLLLLIVLPSTRGTSRAQSSGTDSRFAFADTTLLRDTLGLSFSGLFPIADSLRMPPDTLRALSIRYRWTLDRLVKMSDSLGVPVDSVGPVIERERFNPLSGSQISDNFTYSSTYNVGQTSTAWGNTVNYRVSRGRVYVNNSTSLNINKNQVGRSTSEVRDRNLNTELGWSASREFSVGFGAVLGRFNSYSGQSLYNQNSSTDVYTLNLRSTQKPSPGLSTRLNFSGGVLVDDNSSQNKRGLRGELSGEAKYTRGQWLTHNLNSAVTTNLARLDVPFQDDGIAGPDPVRTRDLATSLRGTLGLWASSPIALNANYRLSGSSIATPGEVVNDTLFGEPGAPVRQITRVQKVRSANNNVDGTLRMRLSGDRGLDLSGQAGSNRQATAAARTSQNTTDNWKTAADGRFGIGPFRLLGTFSLQGRDSRFPNRDGKGGGYTESSETNSLDGSVEWRTSSTITTRLRGSVSLNTYRYVTLGTYTGTPVPRDQYAQSYEVNSQYRRSDRLSSSLGLQVSLSQLVNIPASSTASNTETRSYRASWQWNYRLLSGLTATQTNQLSANYVFYPFLRNSNRVSLEYNTATQLDAVLSPRFSLQLNQIARIQPSGNYRPVYPKDPTEYFTLADENLNYGLNARVTFALSPALSMEFRPDYLAIDRNTTVNGELGPQRQSRTLTMGGGANLNLKVGKHGRLSGSLNRRYRAERATNYNLGVPSIGGRSETRGWDGNLQLTWNL